MAMSVQSNQDCEPVKSFSFRIQNTQAWLHLLQSQSHGFSITLLCNTVRRGEEITNYMAINCVLVVRFTIDLINRFKNSVDAPFNDLLPKKKWKPFISFHSSLSAFRKSNTEIWRDAEWNLVTTLNWAWFACS